MAGMRHAKEILDQQFLEMRWRCLSLAADLDRVQAADGGKQIIDGDPRLKTLRQAMQLLLDAQPGRAAKVQMLFSDTTPPPAR